MVFFPSSNRQNRWATGRHIYPNDSAVAIDILEELGVLSWKTALECVFLRYVCLTTLLLAYDAYL